jgi:uncharacterized protein (DUF1919 family)
MWAAFYLKNKAFIKFKPYIAYYLERENVASYDLIVAKAMNTVGHYLELFL